MRSPKSLNNLKKHIDEQFELVKYYLNGSENDNDLLKLYATQNDKIKSLLEESALEKKVDHARFINKIRKLDVLTKKPNIFNRLKIATLYIFGRLDANKVVK